MPEPILDNGSFEGFVPLASRDTRPKLRPMLNYIWAFLLLTGLVAGALFGRLEIMVGSVFDVCKDVVMIIALPLAGVMMLWLGILRVMEKAGLMEVVARML